MAPVARFTLMLALPRSSALWEITDPWPTPDADALEAAMRAAGHDLRVFDDPRDSRCLASPFRLYHLCLNGRPSSMGLLRAAVQAVELSPWRGPSGSELEIEVSIGWTDGLTREVSLGLARMPSAADHL